MAHCGCSGRCRKLRATVLFWYWSPRVIARSSDAGRRKRISAGTGRNDKTTALCAAQRNRRSVSNWILGVRERETAEQEAAVITGGTLLLKVVVNHKRVALVSV
ncbi:hypothetical protein KCP74_06210 [Salmonella enterica subsp. enterica]|nr:hypothetical protein KCP74_06210 [Salmonella enterica subsp. enterica]